MNSFANCVNCVRDFFRMVNEEMANSNRETDCRFAVRLTVGLAASLAASLAVRLNCRFELSFRALPKAGIMDRENLPGERFANRLDKIHPPNQQRLSLNRERNAVAQWTGCSGREFRKRTRIPLTIERLPDGESDDDL